MTDFVFEQIDAAHPPLLDLAGNTDRVIFHGGPARLASVTFALVNGDPVTTVAFGGHSVAFDPGIQLVSAHGDLVFDDGSALLIGGPRDEVLEGGLGDDALFGGAGADSLSGHFGSNFLQGNQGNDSLAADDGADTIFGGQGDDFIRSGFALAGEAGNFAHGNLGDDTIAGGAAGDTLLGGQGSDLIFGEAGADFLNGNLGDDHIVADGPATLLGEGGADTLAARGPGATLAGGTGADLFGFAIQSPAVITSASATITDWASEDSIVFTNVGSGHAYEELVAPDFASALAAANRAIAASTDPMKAGGEVVVVEVGADLFAFAANAGSLDADYAIRIVGRTLADVSASDFL